MAELKLNNSDNYETIGNFKLSKDKTPIAYENKVQELIEECGMSREEAEHFVDNAEFELEIYYHKSYGLFAVEAEAVEGGADIYSPYTADEYELCDE